MPVTFTESAPPASHRLAALVHFPGVTVEG